MKNENVIYTATAGAVRLKVRSYAGGRFGFDYARPNGERGRVRVTDSASAIGEAKKLVEQGVGQFDDERRDPELWAEFLRWKSRYIASAPVPKLVAAFIQSKERKGLTLATVRELKSTLDSFAKAFPDNISMLVRGDVEKWMDQRNPSPRRWNNMRAAIISLHRFARRDGLLSSELTPVERMDKRRVRVTVGTYSPAEMRAILSGTPEDWIPWVALGAFCGLRPEEIHPDPRASKDKPKLCWEHILWAKKKVDVPAEIAKDRRRRFAPLTDAAIDFLSPWKHNKGPITAAAQVYRMAWWQALTTKNDGFRHSFASYRLALTNDCPALSEEMGNSVFMIRKHYLDRKHEDEAAEYFGLRRANVCQSTP